jgi:TetR/AcrR family transcriptional regulator
VPTRPLRVREASGRPPTSAERARREELLEAAIQIVAQHGWASFTVQRVADRVGITKAAVIYHVGTRDELVRLAYARVLGAFQASVEAEVDAATDPADTVERVLRSQLRYFREHPEHARFIVEALTGDGELTRDATSPERREVLADLIVKARGDDDRQGARVLAVLLNGGLDAAVGAYITDPAFDLLAAEVELIALLRGRLRPSSRP